MLLGVDVGGTFTDAALLDGDRLHTAKVPSTPENQSRGVIAAVESVLRRAEAAAADVEGFTHGMTVGTNALLEERGARTALVATRGFADLLDIGRQARPSLYHPCRGRPRSLVGPEDRFEANERTGASGVIDELADEETERLVDELRGTQIESIAVWKVVFSARTSESGPIGAPNGKPGDRLAHPPSASTAGSKSLPHSVSS